MAKAAEAKQLIASQVRLSIKKKLQQTDDRKRCLTKSPSVPLEEQNEAKGEDDMFDSHHVSYVASFPRPVRLLR